MHLVARPGFAVQDQRRPSLLDRYKKKPGIVGLLFREAGGDSQVESVGKKLGNHGPRRDAHHGNLVGRDPPLRTLRLEKINGLGSVRHDFEISRILQQWVVNAGAGDVMAEEFGKNSMFPELRLVTSRESASMKKNNYGTHGIRALRQPHVKPASFIPLAVLDISVCRRRGRAHPRIANETHSKPKENVVDRLHIHNQSSRERHILV